jgi:hypothetical protein
MIELNISINRSKSCPRFLQSRFDVPRKRNIGDVNDSPFASMRLCTRLSRCGIVRSET